MNESNKPISAVASAQSTSRTASRRLRGKTLEELQLTDEPLPGGGEPIVTAKRSPKNSHIPSTTNRENARDFATLERIEDPEGSEEGLSVRVADARARESVTEEPIFDPFSLFDVRQPNPKHPRMRVDLEAGFDPHRLGDDLWRYVARTNRTAPLLYVAADRAVRLEHISGVARTVDLNHQRLAHEVQRIARFVLPRKDGVRNEPAPAELVAHMLATPVRNIPLPRLRRIAFAPFVTANGAVIVDVGYHAKVETFLDFRESLPPVPSTPTAEDVRRAKEILTSPLVDFPFANAPSRVLAVAVMLLPFVRHAIDGPTPLHLIDKTTPGTGATLLTDALLCPAIGTDIPKMSAPVTEAEWFYSLQAQLGALPEAVVIDNARELKSKELAKALTDTVLVGRIVGSSTVARIPIHCVWLANGNNVTLHQENARRVVLCKLDAGMECPWQNRQFRIQHLRQWLRQHRTEMIWACLTIIRSWFAAGCPPGSRSLGMFESYASVIGGILEHIDLGLYPSDEVLPDATDDLQSEAEKWVVAGWWARHRGQAVEVGDLLSIVTLEGSIVAEYWGGLPSKNNAAAAKLGHFLRGILGKTFNVPAVGEHPAATLVVHKLDNDPVSRRARYQLFVRRTD